MTLGLARGNEGEIARSLFGSAALRAISNMSIPWLSSDSISAGGLGELSVGSFLDWSFSLPGPNGGRFLLPPWGFKSEIQVQKHNHYNASFRISDGYRKPWSSLSNLRSHVLEATANWEFPKNEFQIDVFKLLAKTLECVTCGTGGLAFKPSDLGCPRTKRHESSILFLLSSANCFRSSSVLHTIRVNVQFRTQDTESHVEGSSMQDSTDRWAWRK